MLISVLNQISFCIIHKLWEPSQLISIIKRFNTGKMEYDRHILFDLFVRICKQKKVYFANELPIKVEAIKCILYGNWDWMVNQLETSGVSSIRPTPRLVFGERQREFRHEMGDWRDSIQLRPLDSPTHGCNMGVWGKTDHSIQSMMFNFTPLVQDVHVFFFMRWSLFYDRPL